MLYQINNSNASVQKLSELTSWFLHLLTGLLLFFLLKQSEVEPVDTPSPNMPAKSKMISFSIHVSTLDAISHDHTHKLLWYNLTRVVFNCRIVWPNQPWQWLVPEPTAMTAGSHMATGSQSNQFKSNTHKPVGQNRSL